MYTCSDHTSCIEDALKNADLICRNKGLRFTPIRKIILEMIWASHNPIKAYDILDLLQKKFSTARPTTVYRSIDFLIENGFIHKLNGLSAYVGCSHPQAHKNCYFLICNDCGSIEECFDDNLTQIINTTSNTRKFEPDKITIEVQGKCQGCH